MVAAISAWGATVQGRGKKTLFWISTILSALCLVLVGVDIILLLVNQRAQAEVNERQRTIAESIQLKQVQQALRVALTGKGIGFGLYETLAILGREQSVARIDRALARLAT